MSSNIDIIIAVIVIFIAALVGIWGNWVWIGKDGFTLPHEQRPSFRQFWFNYLPRKAVGRETGIEDVEL